MNNYVMDNSRVDKLLSKMRPSVSQTPPVRRRHTPLGNSFDETGQATDNQILKGINITNAHDTENEIY